MKNKKETYLMKLAVLLFALAAEGVIIFGVLTVIKMPFKVSVLPAVASFMFCVWAIILLMIDKKADKLNKNNVMAKPEDVQKEILEKLNDIGLKKGTFRSKIDNREIEVKLINEIEEISWVGIREEGTRLENV